MYTIETINWSKIKFLWEQWRTYDITGKTHAILIDKTFIDPKNILEYEKTKTIAFMIDKEIFGCAQITDFSEFAPKGLKVAGIRNIAVRQTYRNNGIGKALMDVCDFYIKFMKFDLSMLYASLYANQMDFYERFGYAHHGKISLKYYGHSDLSVPELDKLIKDVGKF